MRASREESGFRPRRFEARTAAGLIVAGLVFGGAASVLLRGTSELLSPVDAAAAEGTPSTSAPAKPTPATPAAPASVTTSKAAPPPAKPASVTTPVKATPVPSGAAITKTGPAPALASTPAKAGAKPVATPSRTSAASGGALARVQVPAAPSKPAVVQPAAHLDEHVTYQYNALGRRDPFQPILGGEFLGADVGGDAPVDIGGIKVVGIMWGASDKFALVEDGRGNSLVLRAGDKVMNGVVEAIQREAVVVKLTVDEQTQSVVIPLTRKGDQNNASR